MYKQSWVLLLAMAGLFLIAAGCTVCSTKKVPCNAFSDADFGRWFPYTVGTTRTFKNLTTGDTTTFAFNDLNSSSPYEASVGGIGSQTSGCSASASITANGLNGSDYMSVQYQVDSPFSAAGKTYRFTLAISNGLWSTGKINATDFERSPGGTGTTADATDLLFSNGTRYANVVTITSDTSNPEKPAFYKVTIAKGSGVIGYEAYPTLEKWVIQ